MSTQNPRRPASSRTTTPRPRKIAGRLPESAEPESGPEPTDSEVAEETSALPRAAKLRKERVSAPEPARGPATDTSGPAPSGRLLDAFRGQRITTVLLVALGVLAVVVAAQGVWLFAHHKSTSGAISSAGTVNIPAGQPPVQMNQSDIDQGVDQAAKDVVTLMSLHYQSYDADVAKAVDLATTHFAPQYRQLTADTKSSYVSNRIDLSAKVIGQGVVKADTTRLQALLFVNQFTTKGIGKHRRLVVTSFRVLMTMVHTNTGWLVDGMDTQ